MNENKILHYIGLMAGVGTGVGQPAFNLGEAISGWPES